MVLKIIYHLSHNYFIVRNVLLQYEVFLPPYKKSHCLVTSDVCFLSDTVAVVYYKLMNLGDESLALEQYIRVVNSTLV